MDTDRLLAMTDGVGAIIITIMVLELKVPEGATWEALEHAWTVFVAYALSFVYVAIYWNNHHHYFHLVCKVDGPIMWANFNLLFWLSPVPFATGTGPSCAAPWAGALCYAAVAALWLMPDRRIEAMVAEDSAKTP